MAEIENAKDLNNPDPKCEDANGDEKAENIEVHSANAWEKADLGDEDRKNKFLRLMGAGKKEHHGRFVIGENNPEHIRKRGETEKLQHQLEDQYTQSMQHRLAGGRRGHIGLGYHDADKAPKTEEDAEEQDNKEDKDDCAAADEGKECEDEEEKKDTGAEEVEEKPSRKRQSTDGCVEDEEPDEKKIKFVKSSS